MKKNIFIIIVIIAYFVTSHAQDAMRGPASVDKTAIIILNKFIFSPKDSNSNLVMKEFKSCDNIEKHLFVINGVCLSENNFIQLKCRRREFLVDENFYEVLLLGDDSLKCIKEIRFYLKTKLNIIFQKQPVSNIEIENLLGKDKLTILHRKKRFLKKDFFEIEFK